MAGTGGRGRPGRRLRRVDETSAGGLVVAEDPVHGPRAALIGRTQLAGREVLVRADSAFYSHALVAAVQKAGAKVSITVRMDPAVKRAITGIDEDAWTTIKYTDALFDETTGSWISTAQVAEVPFTAFTSQKKADQIPGRLIVRRIPDLNPGQGDGQDWGSPETAEASAMRSSGARDAQEVRPGVPRGSGPDRRGDGEADRPGRPRSGGQRGHFGQLGGPVPGGPGRAPRVCPRAISRSSSGCVRRTPSCGWSVMSSSDRWSCG